MGIGPRFEFPLFNDREKKAQPEPPTAPTPAAPPAVPAKAEPITSPSGVHQLPTTPEPITSPSGAHTMPIDKPPPKPEPITSPSGVHSMPREPNTPIATSKFPEISEPPTNPTQKFAALAPKPMDGPLPPPTQAAPLPQAPPQALQAAPAARPPARPSPIAPPPVRAAEGRRDPRFDAAIKIEYPSANAFIAEYTRSISRGGMFVRTDSPRLVGTELSFALRIPRQDEPLFLRGRVAWTTSLDDVTAGREPGMGVSFIFANEAERLRVENAVEKLVLDELGPVVHAAFMSTKRT